MSRVTCFLQTPFLRAPILGALLLVATACGDPGQNAGVPLGPDPTVAPARALVSRDGVLVIAHRGASKAAPENTLPALSAGVAAGADLVELDYHHSRDGHPVVFHDKTLDRTTDAVTRWGGAEIAVSSRALSALQTLDAGAWFAPRFAGTRIPTLEDALEVIQAGSRTLIEHKAGDADTLIELLRAKGLLTEVVIQSFDWDFLARCRALAPGCVLGALVSKGLTSERLDRIVGFGAAVVGGNHKHVTPALIEAVHARDLKLWVYTVDDPERARTLVSLGIDGIITNTPAAIRAALP